MNVGDFVTYYFHPGWPISGVVVEKYGYEVPNGVLQGTYLYSVKILEHDGTVEKFDVHEGDEFEVVQNLKRENI